VGKENRAQSPTSGNCQPSLTTFEARCPSAIIERKTDRNRPTETSITHPSAHDYLSRNQQTVNTAQNSHISVYQTADRIAIGDSKSKSTTHEPIPDSWRPQLFRPPSSKEMAQSRRDTPLDQDIPSMPTSGDIRDRKASPDFIAEGLPAKNFKSRFAQKWLYTALTSSREVNN
jgi:hypothetical protein